MLRLSFTFARYFSMPIALLTCSSLFAAGDALADLPKKAIEQSQITLPGSHPFVLKASVHESTNPANQDYKAEIEEYWVAPDKWRRTVKSPNFSEILVTNGGKTDERISGDYYPNWLRTIVSAIFDPGAALQGLEMTHSSDNPVLGTSQVCRRFTFMAGIAPVSNKVFSTYCFDGGLVASIGSPGYSASYKDYKKFGAKRVARKVEEYIEPGTDLEADITELRELDSPDESMFAIPEANSPLQTVRITEESLRSLAAGAPDIVWPKVTSGAVKGTLSLYVCLDRSGRIREVYELNSSNPGLSDVARNEVMKWQFKTATQQGTPVQVEGLLTFAFETTSATSK